MNTVKSTLRWHAALLILVLLSLFTERALARDVAVGVYQNEPKVFAAPDGQPTGILGDLLQQIAKQEGWALKPVQCNWADCLAALQAGQIDLMPDMAFTAGRDRQFDFSRVPSLHSWSQLYQPSGVTLNSFLDLQDKRVAVLAGSVQQDYLAKLLPEFGLRTQLVAVKSMKEAFEMTASGQVEAAAANRFYGDLQAAQYKLQASSIVFQPAQLFFATGSGRNADLLAAIDRRLTDWQAESDSPYYRILTLWLGEQPTPAIPAAVWWGLAALLTLLMLALAGGALLRRQVAEQTRHLRASEEKLSVILNSVDAHIYIKGTDLRYQYANRKVCEMYGMPLEQVIDHVDSEFFDADSAAQLHANDLRVVENGDRVEIEETLRTMEGASEQTYLSIKLPLRRPDGTIYALCGISTDITRQKANEKAIHQLAFYDPLTDLPNRRLMMDRLAHSLASAQRHQQYGALLMIDLDNFKDVNDTRGHAVGDQLLREVANRLRDCTRAEDDLARPGSDEFVVTLQGLGSDFPRASQQVAQAAQKIENRLSQPYQLDSGPCQATVSIGVAMFGDPSATREDLLKQVDLAMYQAKADGRNTVRFFDPEMQDQVSARAGLEGDLRQALTHAEFVLYFQPQVNAQGQQIGVEALIRWQHPTRGLVLPFHFIPAAEACGLILPLGRWVLQSACLQLAQWGKDATKAKLCMAVNVSARELQQDNFARDVLRTLEATGANPERLEIELTESHLVVNVESVIAKMALLRAKGVRIALDDFGTGYSSLNILKRLPLDRLKIDQSFVRDLLTDSHTEAIVKTIITLGQSLGLEVIAEGVETQAERDALLALGCDSFQGYLFGRPVPLSN